MSTFFGFDPFEDLLNMQRQMDSLLNAFGTPTTTAVTTLPPLLTTGAATTPADVGGGRRLATTGAKQRGWSPSLDVCETDKSLVVHAELPGCSKEDIKLSIDNDRLVLQGKKRAHKKEKGENWVRRERFRGSFYRSLPLPRNVDVGGIEASYDNGILEIVVPKSQAHAKRQMIDIKSAQGVTTQPQEQDRIQQRETTLPQPQEKEEEKRQWPQQQEEQRAQGGMPEGVQQPQQMQEQQRSEIKIEQFQQPPQEQQRFDVQPEGQQQQEQQRSDVKFEGVQPPLPPPPLPPQQQEQKVEQPTQEQQKPFAPEEKTEPEQLKPFEEKPVEDIKQLFQGEQQPKQKDQQQLTKLQEESTQSSSIFIQGGESGQVSQEREKGSVQAM